MRFHTTSAALAALCLSSPGFAQEREHSEHRRSLAWGANGMVAAEHPIAVQVGLDVLRRGGSAVDAAIATNAAMGFLEPNMNGMGGDLFAIVWDAKAAKLYGLNASGRCPRRLVIADVKPLPDGTIDPRRPDSWTVPGCVDGWAELHGKFGRLAWREVITPAARLARAGAPVPRMIAGYWAAAVDTMKGMPGFDETFLPGGRSPREGEVFRNPQLAETLERLAEKGRDAFYKGELARQIVEFSARHGGWLTIEDLASHRSEWVEPVSTTYRGVRVFELPPNGQGIAALQMLNILETFDLRAMGRLSPDYWHVLVEAKKLAFADRARFYADPKFAEVPIAGLIAKDYGRERAKLIDMKRAAASVAAGRPGLEHGETTYLCVGDRDGNMVSLIQSNYTGFGSGHAVLGFGMQNRGCLFSLDPKHPNALRPGKRPFHTIIPAFAMKDGKPWLAFGVMGGSMQPQGHVQVLINMIDFDMDAQQAGDAPRFRHGGSSQPTGLVMTDGGEVFLEHGIPDSIRRALEQRGHKTRRGSSYGGYQAVVRDPKTGVYAGATESRKDGVALGY